EKDTSMTPNKPLYLGLAVWTLALLVAVSACDSDEDPDDCLLTDSCGSLEKPNGDNTGNNNNGNNNNNNGGNDSEDTSQWPKPGTTHADVYNFLPQGVFIFKNQTTNSMDIGKGDLIAKNADGSLITASVQDLDTDSYTVRDWAIWTKDGMYYKVDRKTKGEDENKHDLFYTISLKHADSTAATPKTAQISVPWGSYGAGAVADGSPLTFKVSGFNLLSFVNSSVKDEAVFEKDESIAGVLCKKYVYEDVLKYEYWIMDNGLALKRNVYLPNGDLEEVMSFETVIAELDTSSYDAVTQKFARFSNQISPAITEPVADMFKMTEVVHGGEWIAPDTFLEWTYGGFDVMTIFRDDNWEGHPEHQVHVSFPAGTAMATEVAAYQASIMAIDGMVQTSGANCDPATNSIGCEYKYNNSNYQSQDCGSSWEFAIQTWGEVMGTPSTPDSIYIRLVDIVCL
ncbi:MAG: hypothetical protein LBM75_03855, partial [Myxococcales bacterium]|nr:hypothetical protein [Myxococcales bacterium]